MILPALGDDAEAVAVAVEGESELALALAQAPDQVGQVLGLRRIGMVVREVAVHLAEELVHFAAERR